MKLSKRLQLLHDLMDPGRILADIGSDHALLPVACVRSGHAVKAIAGELNEGPFEAAKKQVASAGLSAKIEVRRGDGLDVIEPGEVDTVTIAGMGGALIAAILDRGIHRLKGVTRLILQPNVGEDILRKWLYEHDFVVEAERIIEEDGKIYEVIAAVPAYFSHIANDEIYEPKLIGTGENEIELSKEELIAMGPFLVEQGGPVFIKKWYWEMDKLKHVLKSLSNSDLPAAREKAEEIQNRLKRIEEVLLCMQKDKL
ncbi:tRNA (adenine(22)-N(1))-methyltransferase [Paenibacillus sp. An7]|uniref:tRNA (adenine(22)-N(1))-methyltransferase n=1 Tax=Paenibacillus sp. An7 TaxID=2689577 RepID=UPI00135815CF|nr:class I SAM-dependent methyltransferase [Paenibacillus sp. An7]